MTTMEERIAKIQKEAELRNHAKLLAEQTEQNKRTKLFEKIEALSPRIKNLLKLGEICVNNGIEFGAKFSTKEDRENTFYTEGFYHKLGFVPSYYKLNVPPFEYLGVINGGACGSIDLFVDKSGKLHAVNNDYPHNPVSMDKVSSYKLEEFIREFDDFETRFLNFVDKLGEVK